MIRVVSIVEIIANFNAYDAKPCVEFSISSNKYRAMLISHKFPKIDLVT
ncbi:hypothetical protein [uncultured Winogradskyella sp.]|nr:hypothetical protein [uncultured Winogradskyella sp.]